MTSNRETSVPFGRRVVVVLSGYALAAGLLTLIGWCASVPRLTDWVGSGISMFANTAIAASCAGASLILGEMSSRWAARLSSGLGAVVLALGIGTLFQHISGIDLKFDELVIRHSWGIKAAVAPGRMGPPASTCFALIGIALLLLRTSPRARRAVPVLGLLVGAISMLSLIGYLLGAQPLFSLAGWTGIAFQTASILFALGLALVASVPNTEPAWTFSQNTAAGVLARRSLPLVILLCFGLGLLRVQAQNAGWVDTAMGTAVLVLTQIMLFSLLLWWCVRAVASRERKQKIAEAERERLLQTEHELRAAAEEANRLKDEFLAIMSHELRNPLNVILGYSELLVRNDEVSRSKELSRTADAIKRNAIAQSKLIRDLLDVSRLRSGKLDLNKETVSMNIVAKNAIDTVRSDAESKNIAIEVRAFDDALFVEGDPVRLEQILWNLLNNAVKFTPRGGKITVRLAKQDGHAVVAVEDTGEGIDPSFLPHAFEMFRQARAVTNRAQSGMGIGLAVVQQLVELHGGSVDAESQGPSKGATFTIKVPLTVEPRTEVASAPDKAQGLDDLAVLVVDDSKDTIDMLEHLLKLRGARVTATTSGEEALRMLADRRFDVVLSDISMPGMDGFEFLRKIRQLPGRADVPVLALTGFGRPEDIERADAAGFLSHITKPFDLEALVEKLARLPVRRNGR